MPTEIDCDLLNIYHSMSTFHSISHATLFWRWFEQRSTKYYSVLKNKKLQNTILFRTTLYFKVLLHTTEYYSGTIPYFKVQQRITKYCKMLPRTSPFDSRNTWKATSGTQNKTKRLVVGCGFCTLGDPLNLQLVRIVQSRTHNSTA